MSNSKYVSPEYIHSTFPAIAAGKTGKPEVLTFGGVKASAAKIVFTGNLVAGDTVTVNGKVFTCKASGATGEFQFDVDSTLSLSLDALVTKLNACTDPLVSIATYSKTDTNTALTMTFDAIGIGQNDVVVASTHSTVALTQPSGGKDITHISLETEHTQLVWDTSTETVYLPDGDESQRKTITMSGTGTANVVSLTDLLPGSTNNYAMSDGDVLVLQFLGGKWRLILNDGATAT